MRSPGVVRALRLPPLKPGWYLLILVTLYALLMTVLFARSNSESARDATTSVVEAEVDAPAAPEGFWFPIAGARVPASDANLPGAPRTYRHGVSQGFDFYDVDAGVPIMTGTPVIAAEAGQIVRADVSFTEIDPRAWELLMTDVAEAGASDEELDKLRGRQVWVRTADGSVLRYGHLAGVRSGLRVGVNVYRGQVLGYVGNSGTERAITGSDADPRLRFEIWTEDGEFFGAGMDADEVRHAAASLFVGP